MSGGARISLALDQMELDSLIQVAKRAPTNRHIPDTLHQKLDELQREVNGHPKYLVHWCHESWAETPEEAAREARVAQIAEGTLATVFDVRHVVTNTTVQVDTRQLEEEHRLPEQSDPELTPYTFMEERYRLDVIRDVLLMYRDGIKAGEPVPGTGFWTEGGGAEAIKKIDELIAEETKRSR